MFLQNANISFFDGATITGLCVLIVFAILIVLAVFVSLLQFVNRNKKEEQPENKLVTQPIIEQQKSIEITDDDMMAAVLVATIDYHNEIKQDVRVVSVKQIG